MTYQDSRKEADEFNYDDFKIDVFICKNEEYPNLDDAYAELHATTELLKTTIKNHRITAEFVWQNCKPIYRLTKDNKRYIHVLVLSGYISVYEPARFSINQYFNLRQLIQDLHRGSQMPQDDLSEIKSQICNLQDCLVNSSANGLFTHTPVQNVGDDVKIVITENIKDMLGVLRLEISNLLLDLMSNIKSLTESMRVITSSQNDITTKLAFSNDTMLDRFKSIKDLLVAKPLKK
ncbi:P24 [Operophtera brumata nucleopolyhedrovirus]|uniref:P24 n=1 Tax=Operophtera brumata nucleopolyhedrovirus TaxID=1046267 RepID=A0A2H4UZX3_9ABAC|nr:P24 [Operophtera brumata nucleopolyhedrovirus]AUA60344.1 P24 [Operophtera brumata nucleopolyhedrovirus]